jgi:hypothetical protein
VASKLTRALHTNEWLWTVYSPTPKQGKVVGDRFFAAARARGVIDALCREGDRSRRPPRAALRDPRGKSGTRSAQSPSTHGPHLLS